MNAGPGSFRQRALPIALSQAVGVACGVLGVKVVSRWVPPDALGVYGVFLTFTTLGVLLVHAGLIKYLNRNWAAAPDRANLVRTVRRAWFRRLPLLAVACAAVAWSVARFGDIAFLPTWGTLLLSATLLSFLALVQAAFQADREHWPDFVLSATGSVARSFVPALLFAALGGPTAVLFLGFALYTASNAAVAWLLLRLYRWRRPGPAAETTRDAAVPGVFLGPLFTTLALVSWALTGVNRWLVAWRFDETMAGYFTFAGNVGTIVPAVLGGMFLQYFQPGIYAAADRGGEARAALPGRIDRLVLALIGVGMAGLVALWLASPLLVGWLIAPRYLPALPWILPTGAFALTVAASQFYHVMLLAVRKERLVGKTDLSLAAVLIGAAALGVTASSDAFWWVLTLSPALTWLVSRTIARAVLRGTDSSRAG